MTIRLAVLACAALVAAAGRLSAAPAPEMAPDDDPPFNPGGTPTDGTPP